MTQILRFNDLTESLIDSPSDPTPQGYINISARSLFEWLRLPEEYQPAGLYFDEARQLVTVVVANKDLPCVSEGEMLPRITPIYCHRITSGVRDIFLDHVEVEDVAKRKGMTW